MGAKYSFSDSETGGMLELGGHEQRYEQAFQIAIIACDENFNELEVHDLRARRKAGYVPAAGAAATTRIHPDETDRYKTSEYDMAHAMQKYITANPGSIFMYWNMKYDTPIKRQTFFRNLFDPLLGNAKADGMRIAKAIYCFNPASALKFPVRFFNRDEPHKSSPSLKLGNMCAENGITLIGAHDAIPDTRALKEICKLMSEQDSRTWNHMMSLCSSRDVLSFMTENKVFMWTAPDATNYATSAYCYATHKGQGNIDSTSPNLKKSGSEAVIVNLAVAPATWMGRDERELALMLRGRNPDDPTEKLRQYERPFEVIKINDQPIIWPYMEDPALIPGESGHKFTLRDLQVSALRAPQLSSLTRKDLEERATLIKTNTEACARLSIAAANMWPAKDDGPPLGEDRIYDGIGLNMPPEQSRLLRICLDWFHEHPWQEREAIAMKMGSLFPLPTDGLKQKNPEKYAELTDWEFNDPARYEHHLKCRDYAATLKRFGLITLYEQERVHECPGKYLRDPQNRQWVEDYIRTRLTQPAKDSKGEPLKKPKYRTIEDAERLAKADLDTYHEQLNERRRKRTLTPELSEEYARKIDMTNACLDYYAKLRTSLDSPTPGNIASVAAPPPAATFEQIKKTAIKPASKKKTAAPEPQDSTKPVQGVLFTKGGNKPRNAFAAQARRSPTQAMNAQAANAQGKRKIPVVKTTNTTKKAKAAPPPPKRAKTRKP